MPVSLAGNARERAAIKAAALADLATPISFAFRGKTIIIMALASDGPDLIVALKGPLRLNNPYVFRNPPIMVPDGTTRAAVDGHRLINYREDLQTALVAMIAETLRVTVK